MKMMPLRYACAVQYRDRMLWILSAVLVVAVVLLNSLITYMVVFGYEGQTIERVSYSYLYSFSGRVGYIIPLSLSAYLTTASLRSGQAVRVYLLGSSKNKTFEALSFSSLLFGGIVGTAVVIINHFASALILVVSQHPVELFSSNQILPSIRMVMLQWIWALIGGGLAFLINNIAVLMSLILTFSLFVEPTLSAASNRSQSLMSLTKWLPGPINWSSSWDAGAGTASVRTAIGLPGNVALTVMLAYALVVGAMGYLFFIRRSLKKS